MVSLYASALDASAQCNPTYIYGLTNVGMIQRIDVTNGTVAAPINPAFGGNPANFSNALGYNPLNGKYYFFKRNSISAPQEFMSFDPATNMYAMLAPSPAGASTIINLGCVNNSGLGYYCLDAQGVLYYYDVAADTWTTICSNIKDQSNKKLVNIIDAGGLNRYYGDLAIDGLGNLWMLISGPVDYGLYKISAPLPTTAVANLLATQLIAPTTPSPGGTFGGVAFNSTGQMFLSTNSPDNRLFKLTALNSLSFVTNLGVDGIGNDLTSCNFPLSILASAGVKLSASLVNENTVKLNWNILEATNGTSYAIEHSTDGISWDEIYTMKMTKDLVATYAFSQSNLVSGTHYYRLRKTETNGVMKYSTVSKVTINPHNSISIWPNPTQDVLKVQDVGIGYGISQVFIHDVSGRIINQSILKPGVNSIQVQSLPAGTYLVRVKHSNGEVINRKFVKK